MPSPLNFVGVCFICKGRHDNIGRAASRNHPIRWNCWACNPFTKIAGTMAKKAFDRYEHDSMMAGGAAGGQYLDTINQTDLAKLDDTQFLTFLCKIMGGYEIAMRSAMERLKDTM